MIFSFYWSKTFDNVVAPKRAVGFFGGKTASLAACVLGHSLGSFTHGVFGQLTGQKKSNGGLDLAGAHGSLLSVFGQTGSFIRDTVEDIVNERVHDAHGFTGDTSVRVNLFQNLVNVRRKSFPTLDFFLSLFALSI